MTSVSLNECFYSNSPFVQLNLCLLLISLKKYCQVELHCVMLWIGDCYSCLFFSPSHLDYCNSLFACLNKASLERRRVVQNAAARLLTESSKYSRHTVANLATLAPHQLLSLTCTPPNLYLLTFWADPWDHVCSKQSFCNSGHKTVNAA